MEHGAGSTKHSGLSLWDHLSGVHRLLQATGCDVDVCNAGLFHSVYGTQSFKKITVPANHRNEVQHLIGLRAETLVWAFCHLPRPRLFETSLTTGQLDWLDDLEDAQRGSQQQKETCWADLLAIECANLLKQKVLHPFPNLARHAQGLRMLDEEGFSV